jgi:hypothetical protein
VLAYGEIASLRQDDHLPVWTLSGSLEIIVVSNHAGDDADYSLAYAVGFGRHTRAHVVIKATDLVSRLCTIRPRWHEDQAEAAMQEA